MTGTQGRAGRSRAIEIETPHGMARATVRVAAAPKAAVVLGHGAAGGIEAGDLQSAAEAAVGAGCGVALVEQPYRVAGRRSPAPVQQLETAWRTVVSHLRAHELEGLALIAGGRSLGARVACRTAAQTEAVAVLCLAFPLRPPGRRGTTPAESRQNELDAVQVPVLVVQGARDPFGIPEPGPSREVITVAGTHSLGRSAQAVEAAVARWLARLLR